MWDQSRHNLQNTARTNAVNHGTGRQLWRLPGLICYSYSSPAVDINETIYVYGIENVDCNYGTLYAINPDGTIKWQFQSIDKNGNPYWGFNAWYEIVPTIGPDGTIYYADGYGSDPDTNFVYAINPNGTLKWMYSAYDIVPGQYHGMIGTVKIYGDTIYVLDDDHIYALNVQTGTLKWSYTEPNEYDFNNGFVIYNGYIYIMSYYGNGILYKIDTNGQLIWSTAFVDSFYSGISINDNGIFIIGYSADRSMTTGSYAFAKFDINDGHNIWTKYVPIPDFGTGYTIYVGINSFVALDSTSVYYSVNSCYDCYGPSGPGYNFIDGRIFKYDFNGNLIWESVTGLSSISPVIDGDGYIYTGDAKKIVKLNPLDGSVAWLYPITDRWAPSSLAIGNGGTIYFISNDTGYVDAIASEVVELPTFGDGSDGDVIISQDSALTRHTNFRNLTIDEGVKLNTAGYRVRVQNRLTINGTIHNNGEGGSGGYGPNRNPSCDCINCNGGTGMGGYGYGGSGGYGNNDRLAGGGGGTHCGDAQTTPAGGGGPGGIVTSLTSPSLSDLVNYGFPYIGGGGGGGGSSNQKCNCNYIDIWIFGGGGSGGNGGGIVIIQAYEIVYGSNGYVQANGIDGEMGLTRYAHSRDWFFDCCPNFIPMSGGCKTGGFNCADFTGNLCPDFGGDTCPEHGGGGGGGGGGAQFIIHNHGFDLSRHHADPGKGGINPQLAEYTYPGQDGTTGNIYPYQVGTVLQLYATVSAVPSQINSGDTSQITIHVTDDSGVPVGGATVNLSVPNGTLDLTSGTTDVNGDFTSTYIAPIVTDIQTFTVTAITSKSGYVDGSGSTQITVRTPANVISATLYVAPTDCVAPCTVNGTVSWTNTGGTVSPPTDLVIIFNGGSTTVASAVVIGPGEMTAVYPFTISNLAAGTYTVQASPNTGTTPQTITVRTPANIVATVITPSVTTCTVPCNMTVDITWTNNGGTSGTFIPTIIIDGAPSPLTSESLGAGLSVTKTFTLTGLAIGTHTICSDPNTFPCVTVTVTSVAQAGFGGAGMILLGGLLIGMLISKKCEDYKTKEECQANECQWKKNKCVPFGKEDQYLIAKLREKGAVGTPICKGEECKIGKWVAIYRKGKEPIIIHDPQ